MKGIFFVICMCFVSFGVSAQVSESAFVNPENKYKPVPLWFWNNATVNENELLDQFRQMIRKDGRLCNPSFRARLQAGISVRRLFQSL